MSGWRPSFEDDDDDALFDAEVTEEARVSQRDAVVFLIDSTTNMFQKNEEGEMLWTEAVRCAALTLQDKIISNDNDLLSVVFYGTEQSSNPNDFENIYVHQSLDFPDPKTILGLQNMSSQGKCPYGSIDKQVPFHLALWTASSIFSSSPQKSGYKRVFVFTCEDNPNAGDSNLKRQAVQKARDLEELGIEIEPFPMVAEGAAFDIRHFFRDLMSIDEDEFTGRFASDVTSRWKEMRDKVRRKENKKRALSSFTFDIAGTEIAIQLFGIVSTARKSQPSLLDKRSNCPVKSERNYLCTDTTSTLAPSQMERVYKMNDGTKVIFTEDELKEVKKLGDPKLRLLGFKPVEKVKIHYNYRSSKFVFPDESSVLGSTCAFAALHSAMVEKKKAAICRMISRKSEQPRLVALLPQEEEFDEDGVQLHGSGFHVIYLPWAEDVRSLNLEDHPRASESQVDKAKKIIKAFNLDFDSRDFENPALQKHYANLQALALEQEKVDEVEDLCLPDLDGMGKFSDLVSEFKAEVYGDDYEPAPKPSPRKAPAKKREAPKPADDDNGIDWLAEAKAGRLESFKVPELKEYLQVHALKASGKKADLIQRIKDHLGVE